MILLDGQLRQRLHDALLAAFDHDGLRALAFAAFGRGLHEINFSRTMVATVTQVVEYAEHAGKLEPLLQEALAARPHRKDIRELAEQFGIARSTENILEKVRSILPPDRVERWRARLFEIVDQVCLIRSETGTQTGFLVGPDQVMTVWPSDDRSREALRRAVVSFGESARQNSEQWYTLRNGDPVLFVSTSSVVVLRLSRSAGHDSAASRSSTRGRGFVLMDEHATPRGGSLATVVIYREGSGRQSVSVEPGAALHDDSLTVRYRNAIGSESMGAPVFDDAWVLIAINLGRTEHVENHGVSLASLRAELQAHRFAWSASAGILAPVSGAADIKLADVTLRASAQTKRSTHLDQVLRSVESSVKDDDDDVWTFGEEPQKYPDRWAWAEAAAVMADFDPKTLHPFGTANKDSLSALLHESRPVPRSERWTPSDALRVRALARLARRKALREARVPNADAECSDDPIDRYLKLFLDGEGLLHLNTDDVDELRAMLRVVGWLDGIVSPLPPVGEVRLSLERAMLLAPFQHLTRGYFAGRQPELARLRSYADGTAEAGTGVRALFVHGPGGMGKSALLAHLILAYSARRLMASRESTWRLFVYLDFDRPELDASQLDTVLRAILRQVAPQLPSFAARTEEMLKSWTRPHATSQPRRSSGRKRAELSRLPRPLVATWFGELVALLGDVCEATGAQLLIVLDTLEEVQYATPDAMRPLVSMLTELRQLVPLVRPVFAGRVPVAYTHEVELLELSPLPTEAAKELLAELVSESLRSNSDLLDRAVGIVGGNPLSLRLAAEVLCREEDASKSDVLALEDGLSKKLGDAIVQGRLYERILDHIHSRSVRAIANPGLVLRRITWEVIRDVLAGPCEIAVSDEDAARALFTELSAESALVRHGVDPSVLELRPELRRALVQDLSNDDAGAERRRRIHEAAIAFYTQRDGVPERAEEIYHRLMLDQDPEQVDNRWINGVESSLRTSLEELPIRARAYVANRVGIVDDAALSPSASPVEWEEWAEKRATDLLRLGEPWRALEVLRGRSGRVPRSRLYLLESVALRGLDYPDLEAAELAASRAVEASAASRDAGERREALEELIVVRRARSDEAGVLDALTDLSHLGEALADDLTVLQADVEALEALIPDGPPPEPSLINHSIRVFGRLSDELIARVPELARRLAAQVGAHDQSTLQRVIRVVGTGAFDESAARRLEGVLDGWAQKDPDVAAFVPAPGEPPVALAKVLESLVRRRTVERSVARDITGWLKTFVTPARISATEEEDVRQAVRKASPEEIDSLLQIKFRSEIERIGSEEWVIVYSNHHDADGNGGYFCALIAETEVAKVMAHDSWDLTIGNGRPGFSSTKSVTTYHRFGGTDGVEPLVFVRSFHGLRPDYIEVSEEFRHLLNLYHDRQNDLYLRFDDGGEEEIVVEVTRAQVRIKTRPLRQFLAARGMRLAVYFDSVAFSSADAASVDPEEREQEVARPDLRYSFHISDRSFSDRSSSRILGKRLLNPVQIEDCGIWPYDEKPKSYIEFIIGIDVDGKEVTHSCDPEKLANYFGKNPNAPHFLTPVVFRREVLMKYFDHPEKYEVSDGYLGCAGLWGLRMDNHSEDRVTVFLGDLGETLSNQEQLYWRSFNVAPFGDGNDLSDIAVRRAFKGEFTNPSSPELLFKSKLVAFQARWEKQFGWPLLRGLLDEHAHIFKKLRVPLTTSTEEFEEQLLGLTKLLVDSLNDVEIANASAGALPDETRINVFERFLAAKNYPSKQREIDLLRLLDDARSSIAVRRKGDSFETKQLGLDNTPTDKTFSALLQRSIEMLDSLTDFFLSATSAA